MNCLSIAGYRALQLLVILLISAVLSECAISANAASLELSNGGRTNYSIVSPAQSSPSEDYAVQELAEYLQQITGAQFRIVSSKEKVSGPRIVVGDSSVSRSILGSGLIDKLGKEEFVIKNAGKDLLLVGGRPRGTLYAVYHFLDNVLGVRWWAPGATYVPQQPKLVLNGINIRLKPAFESRDIFLNTAWNADWAARNRLNGRSIASPGALLDTPGEKHGGGVHYGGYVVHTFDMLVPSAKYFDAHPEWYSLLDGKRANGYNQLCLTNPQLLDFMVSQVEDALKKDPRINIVSVSMNDVNGRNCQCSNCRAVDEEEGSPSGSMIRFVNAVAERIEKNHPGVQIQTLAYLNCRQPPKHVKPRHNVVIQLCGIECSFFASFDSPENARFAADLRGWAAISPNIYIWDYTTNFTNFFHPRPNLMLQGPNLRFLAKNKVKGYFAQGSYMTPSGEMEELRAWVLSRLMWNPNQDDKALMDEFVDGYYGRAGLYIKDYISLLQNAVDRSGYAVTFYEQDPSPYINAETMSRSEKLFADAGAAVADQPEVLNRVRRAHMPVQCMWLLNYDDWSDGAGTAYPHPKPFEDILAAFSAQCKADGVTMFAEDGAVRMSDFLALMSNRTLNATVRASGLLGAYIPALAFDGNPTTVWHSGGFGPQWIQKDLLKDSMLKAIHTTFGSSFYTEVSYKIECSLDGKTWQVVVPEKTSNIMIVDDVITPSVRTRFVRTTILRIGSSGTNHQPVVAEQSFDAE